MDDPLLGLRDPDPDPPVCVGELLVVAAAVWRVCEPAHPIRKPGEELRAPSTPDTYIARNLPDDGTGLVVEVGSADVDGCGGESRVGSSPVAGRVAYFPSLDPLQLNQADLESVDGLGEFLPVGLAQGSSG